MKRFFPWTDLFVFGGIAAVATAAVLAAVLTPQEWEIAAVVAAILAPAGLWVVTALVVHYQWNRRPTFLLDRGTAVWLKKGVDMDPSLLNEAIDTYVRVFPDVAAGMGVYVNPKSLEAMFTLARMEFTNGKVWFGEKQYSGLQRGHGMIVDWTGGFKNNAFVHECHHMVEEVVLFMDPDYRHANENWWNSVADLKRLMPE